MRSSIIGISRFSKVNHSTSLPLSSTAPTQPLSS